MHLLITIPNCSRRAESEGTNGEAEQKSFLHSSQRATDDEEKACSVLAWACKEETAAPSDNPGQTKLGGTAAQKEFHPFQLYSKKKIGLFTESAAQLRPARLLDTCCFGKPVSKATPQKHRPQKRSCTAKSLFGERECLTTPGRVKVSLPLLPAPLGAWGREGPLSHLLRRAGCRKRVAEVVCNQVLLPSSPSLQETFSSASSVVGIRWWPAEGTAGLLMDVPTAWLCQLTSF